MVREAYHLTIWEKMQSPAISDDTKPTGKYWIKLASGARNILYVEQQRLNNVFLDQDIKTIKSCIQHFCCTSSELATAHS
jgi:hypothetical protein